MLRIGGQDLVVAPALGEVNPAYHGELLAPWPNRVGEGRYRFRDVDHQLTTNEALLGHAIHGFAARLDWWATGGGESHATLVAALDAQPGYPFPLNLTVQYRLRADGIECSLSARNVGDAAAPVGLGVHPYVRAGGSRLDEWMLTIPSDSVLDVDATTLLPIRERAVEGTCFDFRSGRQIGAQAFSRAFRVEPSNRAVVVRDPRGRAVEVSFGGSTSWVQVYTGDVSDPRLHRRGLAIEPMTCAPNALATGLDLDVVEPGESLTLDWRIRLI